MRRLKVRLFPYDDGVDIGALAVELLGKDLIRRYQDSHGQARIWIRSFEKHQRPHPREPDSAIEPAPGQQSASTVPAPDEGSPLHGQSWKNTAGRVKVRPGPSGSSGSSGSSDSGTRNLEHGGAACLDPVWSHRQRGAPLVGNHAGCFDAPAACERGLCVPLKLGLQWRQQRVSESAIRLFVAATLGALPPGPIGDDPFSFWRAAWSAHHGSRAPAKATLATGRQRAADVTLATLRRGGQS
jgi:hypothetical protein